MKISRWASVLVLCVIISICLLSNSRAQEAKGYTVIAVPELKKMLDKDILVIDTLPNVKYKQEHIPGAKHFEFPNEGMNTWNQAKTGGKSKEDFIALLGSDKNKPIVFYCLDEK